MGQKEVERVKESILSQYGVLLPPRSVHSLLGDLSQGGASVAPKNNTKTFQSYYHTSLGTYLDTQYIPISHLLTYLSFPITKVKTSLVKVP